jgi:hypothetical protein
MGRYFPVAFFDIVPFTEALHPSTDALCRTAVAGCPVAVVRFFREKPIFPDMVVRHTKAAVWLPLPVTAEPILVASFPTLVTLEPSLVVTFPPLVDL